MNLVELYFTLVTLSVVGFVYLMLKNMNYDDR